MKIHEHQAVELFRKFKIAVPDSILCRTPKEVIDAFDTLKSTVVIKAQVLAGGRGKAGGIKLAKTKDEAKAAAEKILGMDIKGIKVEKVLVCKASNIAKEFYVGFINDRTTKSVLLMVSSEGGVEIEEVAKINPEKIVKLAIDASIGLRMFQAKNMAFQLMPEIGLANKAADIIYKLYHCFVSTDASLAEINPLVVTSENDVIALDGKMNFDDNGLFRQPEIEKMNEPDDDELVELEAKTKGLSFIKLEGNIGCMVNGAGLAMATMDMVKLYGGSPANFLDIGGSSNPQKVVDAVDLITRDKNVKVIMINIFGGITRCDDVAKGLVEAIKKSSISLPIVVRLAGTNAKEGLEILRQTQLISVQSMDEAAKIAIELSKE